MEGYLITLYHSSIGTTETRDQIRHEPFTSFNGGSTSWQFAVVTDSGPEAA